MPLTSIRMLQHRKTLARGYEKLAFDTETSPSTPLLASDRQEHQPSGPSSTYRLFTRLQKHVKKTISLKLQRADAAKKSISETGVVFNTAGIVLAGDDENRISGLEGEHSCIIRTLRLAYDDGSQREESFHARAIFDTGCPINLISRDMATTLGYISNNAESRFNGITSLFKHKILSFGVLEARWVIEDSPKFMQASFEVVDMEFDVLIGFKTLKAEGLIYLGGPLAGGQHETKCIVAGASFRRQQQSSSKSAIRAEQAAADARRAQNAKAKEAHRREKEQAAHNSEQAASRTANGSAN